MFKKLAPVAPTATISPQDRIVVLMGPTGAGKSTFIDYATQQDGQTIGHSLRSFTADIRAVRCVHPVDGKPVVFVDTPGFDDTEKSDIEIMSMIAGWFVKVHKEHVPLASIIYLHRISDNRMAGSPLKNLQMFASMCGEEAMPQVVLGTTMWSEVRDETGERREKELRGKFWKDMLDQGCTVARFGDSHDSAWELIGPLPDNSTVLLSHEIVGEKKRLNETGAGIRLNAELQQLITEQREAARRLDAQVQRQDDEVLVAQLQQRKVELERKIGGIASQIQQLKIPFRRKIWSFFTRQKGRKHSSSDLPALPPKGPVNNVVVGGTAPASKGLDHSAEGTSSRPRGSDNNAESGGTALPTNSPNSNTGSAPPSLPPKGPVNNVGTAPHSNRLGYSAEGGETFSRPQGPNNNTESGGTAIPINSPNSNAVVARAAPLALPRKFLDHNAEGGGAAPPSKPFDHNAREGEMAPRSQDTYKNTGSGGIAPPPLPPKGPANNAEGMERRDRPPTTKKENTGWKEEAGQHDEVALSAPGTGQNGGQGENNVLGAKEATQVTGRAGQETPKDNTHSPSHPSTETVRKRGAGTPLVKPAPATITVDDARTQQASNYKAGNDPSSRVFAPSDKPTGGRAPPGSEKTNAGERVKDANAWIDVRKANSDGDDKSVSSTKGPLATSRTARARFGFRLGWGK